MTARRDDAGQRAKRLVRWYPKHWRRRYGDEFTEMLISDLTEQPRSWRRAGNVAWSGLVARLTCAGLTNHTTEPYEQVRASLASLGCAVGLFLVFGVAMWSQLTIGWQWARPETVATYSAMILMSATMALFLVLAVLAAAPVAYCLVRSLVRDRSRELVAPTLLVLAGAALLVVGGRHFGNGWPGTGGHRWALQGLVPGGVAAFSWASTLSVSSYWAHPHALAAFPPAEIAWMAVSPVAILALVTGSAKTLRRVELSTRALRYESRLARLAGSAMAVFLIGSCAWVLDGTAGPKGLFHTGAIDIAGLVAMAAAVALGNRASQRARSGAIVLARP
ncbi:MAG: hypothetical protein ABSG36_16105 [Acidimicrobiales bacterium]|jgi:hypothetical protein